MPDRYHVRLIISSPGISAQEITRELGVECDEAWKPGDPRGKSKMVHRDFGWILKSGLSVDAPPDKQAVVLLEKLGPVTGRILKLSERADVMFQCVAYVASRPPLHFEKQVIKKIADMGASLDVDLYFIPE